jgi:4-hydroxyphenylpyruvate dioxygenase
MAIDWMLSTAPLGGSLREKLNAIALAGFRHVELFYEDLADEMETPRHIARMVEDLGLSVGTLLPLRDFEIPVPSGSAAAWLNAGKLLDAACELNTDLVVACSSTRHGAISNPDRVADDMASLADRALTQGLRIGFEALPWATHIRNAAQAAYVVRLANRTNLGLVLDNFHLAWTGEGPESIGQLRPQEIALVQLSDAQLIRGMDVKMLSRNFRCFPGQGDLPVHAFYDAVCSIGYSGRFSLEVFNPGLKARPAEKVCRMAMRSISPFFGSTDARE